MKDPILAGKVIEAMAKAVKKPSDWYALKPLGPDSPFITQQVERAKAVRKGLRRDMCVLYNVFAPFSYLRFGTSDALVMAHLKEDPADFAVWKAAKPGEPAWESPYGMGRPGWHIECSAMSRTHLGKTIDLHCGGQDLIFPHHENEIAQSECANGCEFAHYWMHNGFINVDNQKMSKSLHNFFTVRDVADLYGYEPIRYFMLTAGYRMPLNYTVDLIESCKNSLERLYTCRENLDFALSKTAFGTDETLTAKADEARAKFCKAMDDDLNTPDALAAVFDLVKEINTLSAASSKAALEAAAKAFDEITGVLGLMYNRKKDEVPAEVTERAAAKKAKDWAAADAIRAQLTEMGWAVKDTAQGPQLSKI